MTDSIDLDEMDVEAEADDEPDANKGDWVWRDDGDPDAEPDEGWLDTVGDADVPDGGDGTGTDDADRDLAPAETGADADDGTDAVDAEEGDAAVDGDPAEEGVRAPDRERLPGVPRANRDRPVGVPIEGGGAGGAGVPDQDVGGDSAAAREEGTTAERGNGAPADGGAGDGREIASSTTDGEAGSGASGPHGGGVDDMTMAITYDAVRRLEDPRFAVIDAKGWTDWIGIVGDVPAYEINAFQREHEIDVDFFSGAGQGPAERLADVNEHSMFYAERMALVGVDGEESIADRAGWEFVRLETAAEKADWDLSDDG